jgi:ribosomal protein S12 methylthiotransferase
MERFIGKTLPALVEESIEDGEDDTFYLCRLYCQAPEVDGALVVSSDRPLTFGSPLEVKVLALNGIDLEGVPAP